MCRAGYTSIPSDQIDALIRSRYHGAVNIRGVRYQIIYSTVRSFELLNAEHHVESIKPEGLEDLDLHGSVRCYIQCKTSDKSYGWGQFRGVVKGFLGVARVDPDCSFHFQLNQLPNREIQKIADWNGLSSTEQMALSHRFTTLCNKVGGSAAEAVHLLQRLTVSWQPETELWLQLLRRAAEAFQLGGGADAATVYAQALVARFLGWAKERRKVVRNDLLAFRDEVGRALARETEYQAYGRSLLGQIDWVPDADPTAFRDGRATRPGHVVLGLDVRRVRWMERIEQALRACHLCFVRSSSGQGKSTLVLRFAHEYWPPEHTFILQAAETIEQAEQIGSFLAHRATLGLPTLLIIEADQTQRQWSRVEYVVIGGGRVNGLHWVQAQSLIYFSLANRSARALVG